MLRLALLSNKLSFLLLSLVVLATALTYFVSLATSPLFSVVANLVVTGIVCLVVQAFSASKFKGIALSSLATKSLLDKQVLPGRRLAILDLDTNLLKRWYFDLRLDEEIYRAHRYESKLAIVGIRKIQADPREQRSERLGEWEGHFFHVLHQSLRSVDLGTKLRDGEYCICLPQTDRKGAEAVAIRLLKALGADSAAIGVAECTSEDKDLSFLIGRAFADAVSAEIQPAAIDTQPSRAPYADLVTLVATEHAGEIELAQGETIKAVKARLRRAAKQSGVALLLSEGDGRVHFKRVHEAA